MEFELLISYPSLFSSEFEAFNGLEGRMQVRHDGLGRDEVYRIMRTGARPL
jgi:hypothetical protein